MYTICIRFVTHSCMNTYASMSREYALKLKEHLNSCIIFKYISLVKYEKHLAIDAQ